MKHISRSVITICCTVASLCALAAHAGVPYPEKTTPPARDMGALAARAPAEPLSITLVMRLPNPDAAEHFFRSLYTPGDANYRQFLSAEQFAERFAPSKASMAAAIAGLEKYGLTAEKTSATTLRVTGLPAAMERAFAVALHSYKVPAHGNAPEYSYHAPLSRPTIPVELAGLVSATAGLDNRPTLRPHIHLSAQSRPAPRAAVVRPDANAANSPGVLTVSDFAAQYDVQPLYTKGILGKHRTVGIMTFAALTPSDAFMYWSDVGLTVDPNRLSIVNIDGGPGAPSDASGSDETTLDVEQSGGIAPSAKMIVYQAPNTNQGFVDVLAAAVEANSAQSLSISWGFWEWYQNAENSPVTDPLTGKPGGITTAFHELLMRAGMQGQSVFAASGDGGAYDINHDWPCLPAGALPSPTDTCSLTLSVDYPASDSAITAAGGTTLPGVQSYCANAACTPPYFDVTIANESVWGWDYLDGLCAFLGFTEYTCGIFPAGSGGGVSIIFPLPSYQRGLAGIQLSQPNQNWILDGTLTYALPANFRGRNVPDVSFNADPNTGYEIYYTSDQTGFGVLEFYGGTSFVAPQLNGVTALLEQSAGGRVGLLNYPLYYLAKSGQAYTGTAAPLHAIAYGDNWFYNGSTGYNPAAGLGTLDVANFAKKLGREDD